MLLALNSLTGNGIITKSRDFISDFSNGQASKLYREGQGYIYCLKIVTQLPQKLLVQFF